MTEREALVDQANEIFSRHGKFGLVFMRNRDLNVIRNAMVHLERIIAGRAL
jgi:hypothetical protein